MIKTYVCYICKKEFQSAGTRDRVCSRECKNKYRCLYNKKQIKDVTPKSPDLTEAELREGYPLFYAHCFPIVYHKVHERRCLRCREVSRIMNGNRICVTCHNLRTTYGVLAQ